ncbi:TonB-dependent receptor domain-containing protein [Vibrio gangliei]|uniref:TonB-dependent receptor domain-containing protein n=1 Tax=Vibrio gangliei TaxID=2077090 RepID=UPI000D01241D|nr:TonB-dependent receptor [Vibrio gangliei]
MKKITIATGLSAVASGVLLSFPSYAQTAEQKSATTDVMLVTATKRTEPVTNLVTPIIQISKQDIVNSQANTLSDVLRQLPGVQLTHNGGPNQPARVYVRGSNNVVVLFNGVRLGSATLGYADISQIPLAGVEKIEYLRGSRAAVYGADASAGVINIITRGDNKESTGTVKATGGSNGYQAYTGSVAMVPSEKAWANVTAQYQHSDGYNVAEFGNDDRDGYENTNVIADWGVQLDDNWLIRMNGYYHQGQTEYDYDPAWGASADQNKTNNYNINGQVIYTSERFVSNLTYGNSQDKSKTQHNVPSSQTVTKSNQVTWRNNVLITQADSIGFGAEYLNNDVGDSDTAYDVQERDNKAAYLTLGHNGEILQLEGSVRFDNNEQFGDKTTWQFGAGWQLIESLRLTTNVGTGFKAPTFNDLYYPGFGNPDLKPEESTNYEVALEGEHSWLDWRLAGFYNDIDNRISCQPVYSTCDNDNVIIQGVEWVGNFETGPLYHQVSLEYLKPEDKDSGQDAVRIARQNYKWQVGYQGDNWQTNLSYVYQGKRYDSGNVRLDGYSLVNLAASYDLTANWVVSARIDNLFDADYETASTYIEPERTYYGSIAYQF